MKGELTKAQQEAMEFCAEVCERADALGIGLAKFPVDQVRELIAAVRRAALSQTLEGAA